MSQRYSRDISWPQKSSSVKIWQQDPDRTETRTTYLGFESNVDYPNMVSLLPYFFESFSLSSSSIDKSNVKVTIFNKKYLPLSEQEFDAISWNSTETIRGQSESYNVFSSRGKAYVQLSVPTIYYNEVSGQLEKLVSFEIEISEVPLFSPLGITKSIATTSVLASGEWKMISVNKSGIHKITFSELESMGLSNLENLSIWGNGGKQLPLWNNVSSPDDLKQIPVYIEKGDDNTFNQGDYIVFYAEGPVTWSFDYDENLFIHSSHGFANDIKYFVTTSKPSPLRISSQTNSPEVATYTTNSYDALIYFEKNDTNLIKSGREWYGESFDIYTTREYSTNLDQPVSGGGAKVLVRSVARSSATSSYTLRANGTTIGNVSHSSVNVNDQYTSFASIGQRVFEFPYSQGELVLELSYNKPSPAAKGWLDYISVNARQKLAMQQKQLDFRDVESVGDGQITQFTIDDAPNSINIWDVTDFHNPTNLQYVRLGEAVSFKRSTDTIREFIAFTPDQAFNVDFVGDVSNQDIHGEPQPDMIIVTHPNFLSQANELAQMHMEDSGLECLVVTNQQVYNELSSGNPDVAAIRNMMRMFYTRALSESDMPKYLLLFGDGSYNNSPNSSSNTNFVLTFQSENSVHTVNSIVSDDFYGLLDDNEGELSGLLDIGIGRIPCSTVEEANLVIKKIRSYLDPSSYAGWHNQISFIGDDGDGNLHMNQSDQLAEFVEENYPRYNIEKIYFDAYPMVTTSQGARYPDVTNAIINRANQGTLIMNYIGHANARWLAHEKVLMINDIQSWRNFNKLPLFVTATCEFSRFDDFSYKSAGEHTLFSSQGGSIGLVSTSRVVYANPNFVLNRNFFQYVFAERDDYVEGETEKYYRLGDVLRLAKIVTGSSLNKRNFLLLGDPALRLHYPELDLLLSELNGKPIVKEVDTLNALQRVELKGLVSGTSIGEDFIGEAEVTLYDKPKTITTLANRGGTPFVFTTRENTIYKGRSRVTNGEFSSTFIIPKDIMYSYGRGRFSLYAQNGILSGSGFFEDFIVGGISEDVSNDDQGPEIEVYLNDQNFVSGGITDPNPKLIVNLADSSGINTTGVGIGHDLTARIAGTMDMNYVLNDYYISEVDSYQGGKVEFQLSDLEPGSYTLNVKAWDVYNNSSEAGIDFNVKADSEFTLKHVLNYPNPFTENTSFYFEHNQPFEDFDVIIQIFSPSGKLVKTIDYFFPGTGSYRVGPVSWDGLDDFGDRIGRGVYFYKLKVRLSSGKTASVYQKLVILK